MMWPLLATQLLTACRAALFLCISCLACHHTCVTCCAYSCACSCAHSGIHVEGLKGEAAAESKTRVCCCLCCSPCGATVGREVPLPVLTGRSAEAAGGGCTCSSSCSSYCSCCCHSCVAAGDVQWGRARGSASSSCSSVSDNSTSSDASISACSSSCWHQTLTTGTPLRRAQLASSCSPSCRCNGCNSSWPSLGQYHLRCCIVVQQQVGLHFLHVGQALLLQASDVSG